MNHQNPIQDLWTAFANGVSEQCSSLAKSFIGLRQPLVRPTVKAPESPAAKSGKTGKAEATLAKARPRSIEESADAGRPPDEANPPARTRAAPRKRSALAADPGLEAIRMRVASMETQVLDLETRKAEMEQLLEEFTFRQYQAVGELLGEQLRLQHEILQLRAKRSCRVEDRQAAEAAGDEYQAYERARNAPAATQAIELADDEREELKALYRAAAMRCHPDRVDETAKPFAHEMFLRTQDAYRRRDLETMRLISRQLAAGGTPAPSSDRSTPRERLEVLLESLLDKGAALLLAIQTMQMRAQYRRAYHRDEWEDYFAATRDQLTDECAALRRELRWADL